jgi:hypothetical protein
MNNDENEYGNLFGDWNERPIEGNEGITILDRWFESPVWRGICDEAETGCDDSLELMEDISEHLRNLIFHLENDSNRERVEYELKVFADLVRDYME